MLDNRSRITKHLLVPTLSLLLLISLNACTVPGSQNTQTESTQNTQAQATPGLTVGATDRNAITDNAIASSFKLSGENFKYMMDGVESPTLRVKEGDRVRVDFTSTSGFHDWVVDELDVKTDRVNTGESTSLEFTASRKGEFEYYCSVGSHRAQGMNGKLIVE